MEWSYGVENWTQILEWQKFILHLQIQFKHRIFNGVGSSYSSVSKRCPFFFKTVQKLSKMKLSGL